MKTATHPIEPRPITQRAHRQRRQPPRDWLWKLLDEQGRQKLRDTYRPW